MGVERCSSSHGHCGMQEIKQKNQTKNSERFDNAMRVLEKVSAIALGVISAMTNLKLFTPFFFVGAAIGIYQYATDKNKDKHTHLVSSCSQGLMEGLTGVKLPAIVSLAANVAVTVCHIDHHSTIFVPIIALSIGAWVGKSAAHYGSLACRHIKLVDFGRKEKLAAA